MVWGKHPGLSSPTFGQWYPGKAFSDAVPVRSVICESSQKVSGPRKSQDARAAVCALSDPQKSEN